VFTPVLAKHSRFNLIDTLAGGVDRIQRNLNLVNEGSPQPPSSGHQTRGLKIIQSSSSDVTFTVECRNPYRLFRHGFPAQILRVAMSEFATATLVEVY